MSCELTVDGPCRRTLKFSVERASLDAEIEAALAEVARTTRFKGFRPGKAPPDLVRRTYGKSVTDDARMKLISDAFRDAIREHELNPIGDPEMNLAALDENESGPLTFEFAIEVAPDFELSKIEDLPVTIAMPPRGEDDVDLEVQRFREQAASPVEAPEGSVVGENDVLGITVTYTIEGEELPPRENKAALVKHGLVDGVMIEGAGEAFVGKSVGDTVELNATLPPHFEPEEHGGKQAGLSVTIDKHQQLVVPELDEELLGRAGVKSEEELRQRIAEQMETYRKRYRDEQLDRGLEEQLLEANVFELPERFTDKAIDRRVHDYAHRLIEQQQLDAEEGHAKAETEREQIAEMTRKGLRLSFIFSRVARDKELGASIEDAAQQVRALASMKGEDPDGVLKAAVQEGWLEDVRAQITEEKTRSWLREHAQVTEQEAAAPAAS